MTPAAAKPFAARKGKCGSKPQKGPAFCRRLVESLAGQRPLIYAFCGVLLVARCAGRCLREPGADGASVLGSFPPQKGRPVGTGLPKAQSCTGFLAEKPPARGPDATQRLFDWGPNFLTPAAPKPFAGKVRCVRQPVSDHKPRASRCNTMPVVPAPAAPRADSPHAPGPGDCGRVGAGTGPERRTIWSTVFFQINPNFFCYRRNWPTP